MQCNEEKKRRTSLSYCWHCTNSKFLCLFLSFEFLLQVFTFLNFCILSLFVPVYILTWFMSIMGNKSFCNLFHFVGIKLLYTWKPFNRSLSPIFELKKMFCSIPEWCRKCRNDIGWVLLMMVAAAASGEYEMWRLLWVNEWNLFHFNLDGFGAIASWTLVSHATAHVSVLYKVRLIHCLLLLHYLEFFLSYQDNTVITNKKTQFIIYLLL
jgi:hypothetical protein